MNLNRVLLAGRLTRDPEKRTTPSGQSVTSLGLAINRKYTVSGERKEETTYVDVVAWGRSADACAEFLRKGSPVFVEGRLKLDEWEKDGQKRSKITVVAESVQFLDRQRKDADEAPADPTPAPTRPAPSREEQGELPRRPTGDVQDIGDDVPF